LERSKEIVPQTVAGERGTGSVVLFCAFASARLLPNSVVKSAAVPGNSLILSFFVLLSVMVRNRRIKP